MDGKIIKAKAVAESATGGLSHKVLPHEVYDGKERARELVDAARAEARAIIEAAERDAALIRESARRDGSEEGLARWNAILAESAEERDSLLRESETQIAELAIRVAEKIIGERLRQDPAAIVPIVSEALRTVRRERELVIKVNPRHADEVRSSIDRLHAAVGGSRTIRVAAVDGIPPGGCIVESELGTIDAQLETQLRCLEKALLKAVGK